MQPPHQPPYPQQPPAGLVAPLGPPRRVDPTLRTVVLVALGVLVLVFSVFGGYETALHDSDRLGTIGWFLPTIAVFVAMIVLWQDSAFSLRSDGRVLEGTGLLGKHGIDLARLTSVTSAAARGSVSLTLRDDVAAMTVDSKALVKAGPAALDAVGRAVWAGQEQRRFVVPVGAAGVWGMPTLPGAPAHGTSGVTGRALLAVALLVVGVTVGVVLGSAA